MADTRLEKAYTGSNGNMKKWTISVWLKRSGLNSTQYIFAAGENNSADGKLAFNSSNQLYLQNDGHNGSNNAVQRDLTDTHAWYHIVWRADTDESANNDRWKLYINGELISASEYGSPSISSGGAGQIGKWASQDHWIGDNPRTQQSGNSHYYFDGYMSHFHYCDGYAYDASSFGETDATTGEWKIKNSPSVSYGTNGFFVLKNGNSVTDQSPNTNNLTVGNGTLVDTKDNPSNCYSTSNVLDNGADKAPTFGNGNLTHNVGSSVWRFIASTLGAHKGKFYSEVKIHSNSNNVMVGAVDRDDIDGNHMASNAYPGGEPLGVGYLASNGNKYLNDSGSSYGNSYTANDIIGIAMDIDNGFVYFSKNGSFQNGGDPTSGASGTGGIAFPSTSSATGIKQFVPALNNANISVNYGGGHFGTTAISTNSGDGFAGVEGGSKFNYQPPTGYAALSTKGLNYF